MLNIWILIESGLNVQKVNSFGFLMVIYINIIKNLMEYLTIASFGKEIVESKISF
uniref:Uncharacterized protein n=1 Tax=Rhizophagus irregularis (strain DAOM 181602 / DAOM 197198 / MUCL 43194) TaxID=747089 RepID=U9U8K4_RHIID